MAEKKRIGIDTMRIYDIIKKKRDAKELSKAEINFFIDALVKEEIEDYQVSALLMAMFLNGMTDEETVNLTTAMMHSGDVMDLSSIEGIKVDKHSTGGVGDTTSLVLAPILAACGVKVAKMSGRGLGHTGGTIDKLESIPGFNTSLSEESFLRIVNEVGYAIAGQTKNLAPADKKLYALRDVTATVDSFALIASSIMSKKLASGTDAIILDVKCGDGAFMKNLDDAKTLTKIMIDIGRSMDKKMAALITDMSQPLGKYIGNSLEVIEAIEVLKGGGTKELKELSFELAANLLVLANEEKGLRIEEARTKVLEVVQSGGALQKFREMIREQGGNPDVCDDYSLFKQPKYRFEVKSKSTGYVAKILCEEIGIISLLLGAGRSSYTDPIDMSAGLILNKKVGERVEEGELLATLFTDKEEVIAECVEKLYQSLQITTEKTEAQSLILARISD